MTATMKRLDRHEIRRLISTAGHIKLSSEQEHTLDHCLALTQALYVGLADDLLVCMWGLIPPTLMSEQAYLWLYTTDLVKEHQFLFVRKSQQAIEEMLKEYPLIVGQTLLKNTRAIRWLKWLGATFGEPDGKAIPFQIRRKDG